MVVKNTPKSLGDAPDIVLPPFTVDIWENDRDIVRLRQHFTPAMRSIWDKGIEAFIAGEWIFASDQFNLVLAMTEQKDGPSKFLLAKIASYNSIAPPDWSGHRCLY